MPVKNSRGPVYGTQFLFRRRKAGLRRVSANKWNWTPHDPRKAEAIFKGGKDPQWPFAVQTNYSPSKKRQKVVLLFDSGALMPGLIRWFKRKGLKYFCLDYEQFMRRGTIRMALPRSGGNYLSLGPARLAFADVAAVVWSSYPGLDLTDSPSARPFHNYLFHHRWRQVLRDLRGFLPQGALWLPSHPLNGSYEWQNKLSELELARRAGLRVPETVCTNDRAQAEAFIRRWGGRVIFKEFSHAGALFPFSTRFVDASDGTLNRLRRSPCVFLQYLDKEYDVRAVVIGERVFACRIDSQASELARMDWRAYDNARVRWDRIKLPRQVERSMLRLMRRLDLSWGSFDLVRSTDGRFYFLEVNRPGAQYWLLPFVGLDAAKEMASYLKDALR